jgi:UDP-2,3-diacylglucosamine pyrophosphatase LpxH
VPGKFKIIVSDLHLGAGFFADGNALEDFDCHAEWARLLDEAIAESDRLGADAELIVNGDAFEMLQVPHVPAFVPRASYPADDYTSSSEADSARKMSLIVAGHRPFFEALGRFLQAGPSRRNVTFVKGNHDLFLHWEVVQECIRQAAGATGDRAPLVTFEECCIRREGLYVEHGNQYAEAASRVRDMNDALDPDRPGQLALPWGSWFAIEFLNAVEREKYWVDAVKPVHALVYYALAFDFAFAARAMAALIRALPGVAAHFDPAAPDPRANLARQLDDPGRVREISERHQADELFRSWLNAEFAQSVPVMPEAPGEPAFGLADASDGLVLGDRARDAVRSSLYAAALRRAAEEPAKVVVFGHTHLPGLEELAEGAVYANSGTWTWRGDLAHKGREFWQSLFAHPELYTQDRELSYVRIEYDDAGEPRAELRTVPRAEAKPLAPGRWQSVRNTLQRLWLRLKAWWRSNTLGTHRRKTDGGQGSN